MSETGIEGSEERSDAGAERSVSALFAILWDALADLLGTAATATLIRRAAQRAAWRCPELSGLIITRVNLDYRYAPPSAWKGHQGDQALPLLELVSELRLLLVDLTGPVVVDHLGRVHELRLLGFISAEERS